MKIRDFTGVNGFQKKRARRSNTGSLIVLALAFLMVLVLILFFALSYVRTLGASSEQKTAIESAALTAARDMSQIVVDTKEFGLVGLSDSAPAQTIAAADNWFVPVRSINDIFATQRLDLLLATNMGDPFLEELVMQDRTAAIKALGQLVTTLQDAILPGGFGYNAKGVKVFPYQSAENSYKENQVRMTGGSKYVAGSLKLSLGCVDGGVGTAVLTPQPAGMGQVSSDQMISGYYKSEKNIKVGAVDFVFGSIGKNISLVNPSMFKETIPGLPYNVPAVVKAEADQIIYDNHNKAGSLVHAIAAAQTASNTNPKPSPGTLTVSFPDGKVPEIVDGKSLFSWDKMTGKKMDILASNNGDFPVSSGATIGSSIYPQPSWSKVPPEPSEVCKLAIYDWLRQCGSRVSIQSFETDFLNKALPYANKTVIWKAKDPKTFDPVAIGPVPEGVMYVFKLEPSGVFSLKSKVIKPFPLTVAGSGQLYAEMLEGETIDSSVPIWKHEKIALNILIDKGNPGKGYEKKETDIEGTDKYDLYVRDFVRQPGLKDGGIHAGEPMENPNVSKIFDKPLRTNVQLSKPQPNAIGYLLDRSTDSACGPDYGDGGIGAKPKGKGSPPTVTQQSDFGGNLDPPAPYTYFPLGPAGGAMRSSYTKPCVAVDIRFRRQIKVGELKVLLGDSDIGYVGEMLP
ncbi:MAG: Tad domain-containing protein [Leptolyngbya sp.]|nr:Tad domain-containing protein [Candidatus Melainabacteria bacterium]